jgi:hypothetical protein
MWPCIYIMAEPITLGMVTDADGKFVIIAEHILD